MCIDAALMQVMQAAQEAPPSAVYHASNLLLYLDEPNMGLRLHPRWVLA